MEKAETPPWEAKPAARHRGILRKLLLWTFVLGVVGVVAYGLKSKPVEVEVATVAPGPLTVYVTEEGKTRIRNRYVLSSPVAGQMRRVTLRPGDQVKAREAVTVIEPGLAPLLDARSKAQAEARVEATSAARKKAEQALEMAKTSAQFAKTNWDRVQSTDNRGSISATDRDKFQREFEMSAREVRAAEFSLQIADYELTQAKAALLQMGGESGGTTIDVRAPVDGQVLRVHQESATTVAPGAPILEIGDPRDLEIEAEILSRDAVNIKPGAEVQIEQWGGSTTLKGRVRRIEPAAFTKISALGVEEQRVIVLSDLDHPPGEAGALGDRYRVEVRVAVWHGDKVMLVPAGALFREGSEWQTFVHRAGVAHKTVVKTGRTDGRLTQVLDGLHEGDEVLLHPPDSVKDGIAVVKRKPLG